jgi:hypothetical protein
MNYKVYPRIAAYAEVGWTEAGNKDYQKLNWLLANFLTRWSSMGIKIWPYRIITKRVIPVLELPSFYGIKLNYLTIITIIKS